MFCCTQVQIYWFAIVPSICCIWCTTCTTTTINYQLPSDKWAEIEPGLNAAQQINERLHQTKLTQHLHL